MNVFTATATTHDEFVEAVQEGYDELHAVPEVLEITRFEPFGVAGDGAMVWKAYAHVVAGVHVAIVRDLS